MSTKDVTDEMVCGAVQTYRDAMKVILDNEPAGKIYGITPISESPRFPYEALSEQTGEPEKVCYRAMERAYKNGLIEYGVSLRTGWLTDKGRGLLGRTARERENILENMPETGEKAGE